jgi:cyanobactin maturation PatA/PatG family protease
MKKSIISPSSMSSIINRVISARATNIAEIAGIKELWAETLGDPRVCVAILDGPVDRSHPRLATAKMTNLETLVPSSADQGPATKHGTHVASVLLGQHDGPFLGIAPRCSGLVVPIFKDGPDNSLAPCSQLDLARAISQAVQEGAHIINISGGESSFSGMGQPILADAIRNCSAQGVLVVAATGNEGCDCLHIPAALPSVLAVGAMDSQGEPLEYSNWGESYQSQGILAPGENILGATPGGGVVANSGTSYATVIVSGIAALLLSLQLKIGQVPDPHAVRAALVSSAAGCDDLPARECRRLLAGRLNVKGAMSKVIQGGTVMADSAERDETDKTHTRNDADSEVAAGYASGAEVKAATLDNKGLKAPEDTPPPSVESAPAGATQENTSETGDVLPSQAGAPACSCASEGGTCRGSNPIQLVYALGQLGYDFGTEVRRDSIMQHMGQTTNLQDTKQFLAYLDKNPSDAAEINWILYLDQTAIYAIEVDGPFGAQIGERLRQFLREQFEEGVERISVPGRIVGTTRLFTGQVVPVIHPVLRGMYSWTTEALVKTATGGAAGKKSDMVKNFLLRAYYELRNLGLTPRERAINYSATNAMLVSKVFEQALTEKMELDTIEAERSPICRPDSDCWDVKLTFFDPEKVFQRARRVYRFTADVSDTVPVMVGEVRSWSVR